MGFQWVKSRYIRYGLVLSSVLMALVLMFWGYHLKHPLLLPLREVETPLLQVACALLIGIWFKQPRSVIRTGLLGMLVTALGLVVLQETTFRYRRHVVLKKVTPAVQQWGQHFVVGYSDLEQVRELAAKGLIGGVYLGRGNVEGKTFEQLKAEIAGLQALRQQAGLPPLIIATDQEGGRVSRLSPPLPLMPSLADLVAKTLDPALRRMQAEEYGRTQGEGLSQLGVSVNFSPVVDLKTQQANQSLDLRSMINERAISADPQETTDVALAYVQGLEKAGVTATLKHFPGLGRIKEDTHFFSAYLDTPVQTLTASDWLPFRMISANTQAMLMLGHVTLTQVDPDHPVSFSRPVVQGIIRQQWGFRGRLITDDMTMLAAYRHGVCPMTTKALDAGVDLLLFSFDHDKFYEAMFCLIRR